MDYDYVDCNIPRFSYEDMKKQISNAGNVEWKSKKEIQKEHAKYNTEGKADVIGWISEELATEIIGVAHFFLCCNIRAHLRFLRYRMVT